MQTRTDIVHAVPRSKGSSAHQGAWPHRLHLDVAVDLRYHLRDIVLHLLKFSDRRQIPGHLPQQDLSNYIQTCQNCINILWKECSESSKIVQCVEVSEALSKSCRFFSSLFLQSIFPCWQHFQRFGRRAGTYSQSPSRRWSVTTKSSETTPSCRSSLTEQLSDFPVTRGYSSREIKSRFSWRILYLREPGWNSWIVSTQC